MSRRTKCVVVLGSGRSMTSGVAKGMHLAGFDMGHPLLAASASNPHGHWEHRDLVHLNDKVLHRYGYAWDRPPPVNDGELWPQVVADWGIKAVEYMMDRFNTTGQFGMKDPRVTLLWPLWQHALDSLDDVLDPILLVAQRDEDAVAASLVARDGGDLDKARKLAREYQVRTRIILQGLWHAPPAST